MALLRKQRAQAHYSAGSRILVNASSQKALQQAIRLLQKATKLDPTFAYAFHNLAHAWYTVSEGFITASSNPAFWTNVYMGKGVVKNEADFVDFVKNALESALEAVDRALAIQYEFPQAHNTRAMILAKLFRYDEAIQETEVTLSQDPNYKNASDNREKMKELRKQA